MPSGVTPAVRSALSRWPGERMGRPRSVFIERTRWFGAHVSFGNSARVVGMATGLDFLAVVSRRDFPSGSGQVGDYYNLRALIDRRPDWRAAILELGAKQTEVEWNADTFLVKQEGSAPIDLATVKCALYLPICLEVEETQLCRINPDSPWPRFASEQWRPISFAFEQRLNTMRCLNRPEHVRLTNNKLLQYGRLTEAGFAMPPMVVASHAPRNGPLAGQATLLVKNVSEGGWKSPEDFSPARLCSVLAPGSPESWPVIWQTPFVSDRELRFYVMGERVTTVWLERDLSIVDVRSTNDGKPAAQIGSAPEQWTRTALAMARTLHLDYAVIDAIPVGDELHVLEVNANGVWWFLPNDVGAELEIRFHEWLEGEVDRG